MSQDEKNIQLFFKDSFFLWPSWKQSFYLIINEVFISLGIIFSLAFIIQRIARFQYLAIFSFIFFLFIIFKQRTADCYFSERILKKRKINLANFLSPRAKKILVETKTLSSHWNLSFPLALFYLLLEDEAIKEAFYILDLSDEGIKEIQKRIKNEKDLGQNKADYQRFLESVAKEAFLEIYNLKRKYLDLDSLFLGLCSPAFPLINKILSDYRFEKNDFIIAFSLVQLGKIRNLETIKGLSDKYKLVFQPKKIKVNRSFTSRPTPLLDTYGIDFTELALDLKIGIMVGHNKEYQTVLDLISRSGKRNVLLVGPAGVGKETLVSFLAYNLVRDNVPDQIKNYRLVFLSSASLVGNVSESFDVYNRLVKITEELLTNRDIILFLPQFHTYKQLAEEGGFSALDAFQSLINASWVPIIGAVTPEDYHRYLEKDPLVKENFEIVKMNPVSPEEAIEILSYRSLEFKRKTKIQISFQAIKRAVALAQRFLPTNPLPSSAESLLTEAIEGAKRKNQKIVKEQDIVDLVSVKTQIPLEVSSEAEKNKLLNLEQIIHQSLVNQEEAVRLVASALRQYRAGLANPKKPIAVFLFVGPTGVGKTELAKVLAKNYYGSEKNMIRFDMAEYQDRKSIFRFIGSPEGEVTGALTEAVKNNPFSLLLLDEFEKAHSDVLNIFLSIFDEGRITDNFGTVIDFTNTIIIATSNALSEFIKEEIEKNVSVEELARKLKDKLTGYFKPELLNRFDEVVVFKPLTKSHLKEIVALKLKALSEELMKNRKIELVFEDAVIEKLATLGYNPIFGARPLDAVIRHFIKEKLAQAILKGETENLSKIKFFLEGKEIKAQKE
ncbi:MAG: ATP-dependent Clp protease ATP-binding subunit [Candidatus Pacebacteria bacterium]|nr:ATP-dependent Clp protease ATP-binding subunit [Candidatus Paceibacterota bacterium]